MAAKAGTTPPAGPGHNDPPKPLTQDELDALFVVHLAKARTDNDLIEKQMEVLRGLKKARTRNRTECRTDGFPLKQLDEILADELMATHEVKDREDKRSNMRRVANQPGGARTQGDLFDDSFTQKDKDDADWRSAGYTAGLRGTEAKPPSEMATDFVQVWMEGHLDGQKVLAQSMETAAAIKARGAGATVQ